jgi:hypothetical protein
LGSLTRGRHRISFSTFWIKNLLISYLIGGNAQKADGKEGLVSIRDAASGKDSPAMRVMFLTWLLLIATGLVFYSVIGLAHN